MSDEIETRLKEAEAFAANGKYDIAKACISLLESYAKTEGIEFDDKQKNKHKNILKEAATNDISKLLKEAEALAASGRYDRAGDCISLLELYARIEGIVLDDKQNEIDVLKLKIRRDREHREDIIGRKPAVNNAPKKVALKRG